MQCESTCVIDDVFGKRGGGAACTCLPLVIPACQLIGPYPVVFSGTVIGAEPDPMTPKARGRRLYRLKVDRAYKGLKDGVNEVVVDPENLSTCGTDYLI